MEAPSLHIKMTFHFKMCFACAASMWMACQGWGQTTPPPPSPHPIDVALEQCLQKEDAYTNTAMLQCVGDAIASWDEELNAVYQRIMQMLDEEERAKLRASQRAWIAFKDLELNYLGVVYEDLGRIGQLSFGMDKLNLIKHRTLTLLDQERNWVPE